MRKRFACGMLCLTMIFLAGCEGDREDPGADPANSFALRHTRGELLRFTENCCISRLPNKNELW